MEGHGIPPSEGIIAGLTREIQSYKSRLLNRLKGPSICLSVFLSICLSPSIRPSPESKRCWCHFFLNCQICEINKNSFLLGIGGQAVRISL
jgi:hypothetical protein